MAAAVDRASGSSTSSSTSWPGTTSPSRCSPRWWPPRSAGSRCDCSTTTWPRIRVDGYAEMLTRLEGTGIEQHAMLPLQPLKRRWRRPDLRNHRKMLVVDGLVGFSGSQNLIHPSYHNPKHERAGRRWKELMFRAEGPVAHSLNVVFATDWYLECARAAAARLLRPAAGVRGRCGRPGIGQRTGVPEREQPADVQLADLRCPPPDLDHQPVLRARRLAALRDHHGGPARGGR